MVVRAKLTSKGQVTIPAEVRKRFDLAPGDQLLFSVAGDTIEARPLKGKRLSELFAILPASRPFPGRDAVRREVARKLAKRITRNA